MDKEEKRLKDFGVKRWNDMAAKIDQDSVSQPYSTCGPPSLFKWNGSDPLLRGFHLFNNNVLKIWWEILFEKKSNTVERRLSESVGTGHRSDTRLFG
ncbi:hypothetical protein TNCV_3107471 [Trichonephila clavipes]|nr:hypothetical protein TNCV_3107471 [Trichonephila clavipes]